MISVRVDDDEAAFIARSAESRGVTVSEFMRDRALCAPEFVAPDISDEEFRRRVRAAWANLDSIEEMCRRTKSGRATMKRWLDGTAVPHRMGRLTILMALEMD
jgi:hypothetical protein